MKKLRPNDLLDDDLTKWAKDLLRPLFRRYLKRAKEVYCGRTRVAFDLGTYIVKLPRHAHGFDDNDWEGSISTAEDCIDNPDYIQYARTRLIVYKGVPVLFMEKVETDIWTGKGYEDFPDWVGSVDCGQVGYNKHGRLVAFDYGYH